ncbi:MAG: hypothetical protein HW378_4287, partial [Anaerolineales bacterium]|nr:hypothetical protein [Anaerolineales bacterium]
MKSSDFNLFPKRGGVGIKAHF